MIPMTCLCKHWVHLAVALCSSLRPPVSGGNKVAWVVQDVCSYTGPLRTAKLKIAGHGTVVMLLGKPICQGLHFLQRFSFLVLRLCVGH